MTFEINPDHLSIVEIEEILRTKKQLALSLESRNAVLQCRSYLDQKLADSDDLFYGINTGFGNFCNEIISGDSVVELQSNLVMSHACGMGDEVPEEVVRIMLLLKIRNLSFGHSAAHEKTIDTLIHFYNNDILPVIFQLGSLGASGDLAPLAHLSLPLIGMGEVRYKGKKMKVKDVPAEVSWEPLKLDTKEGLAMLNGTQFSSAYGVWALINANRISRQADVNAALSIDAFSCRISPFDDRIHQIRPHAGQIETARVIRHLLDGSGLMEQEKKSVQDPYAFRCVPQVHGASKDAIGYVKGVLETEINSVTDNPILFPETDGIISGGNFHAQPIALALDFLAIALAELGSISERRVFQLISGQRGLPTCLIEGAGLHSGFMIPQYTAASIISQNKQLCTPASVDSIVSANGQEDHVSMAANAGTKLFKVVENVKRVLSIEWMTACQALEFQRPLKTSPQLEKLVLEYRKVVPMLVKDRILAEDMHKTVMFLK